MSSKRQAYLNYYSKAKKLRFSEQTYCTHKKFIKVIYEKTKTNMCINLVEKPLKMNYSQGYPQNPQDKQV